MFEQFMSNAHQREKVVAYGRYWVILCVLDLAEGEDVRVADRQGLAVECDVAGNVKLPSTAVTLIEFTPEDAKRRRELKTTCIASGHVLTLPPVMLLGRMHRSCRCGENKDVRDPTPAELQAARAER